jgi:thiol-disulfide isomerase/thioredoxin
MHKFFPFPLILALLLTGGCLVTDSSYSRLAPGIWRGVLVLDPVKIPVRKRDTIFVLYEQFKPGELPFNFEVTYTDDDNFYLEIMNGSERIRCDSIRFGHDRRTARDTIRIDFPEYQSYIHADVRGGVMDGEWVVTTKEDYRIPFYAKAGQDFRFTNLNEPPVADLSGDWATNFGVDTDTPEKAVGEFRQEGNRLTGTFRTETGDYRFLEGTIQGRKFWLSCFDGAHAYLFSGAVQGDSLQGEFRSGTHFRNLWSSWRDPAFKLADPDSLTTLSGDAGLIRFDFTSPEGRQVRFPSPAFDNKVKIFTLMGTWCPNCRDEQTFLANYLRQHPEQARDIAVVGFAFERYKDTTQANAHLRTYRERLGLPFDLVLAGSATKADASGVFPMLSAVSSFPTMIILDKNNQVRRIHTGFEGPATSRYADFQKEFEALMNQLTQQ